jgi:uncharacterized small protein (DUF1192 family)
MVRFAQLRRQGAATATERRIILEEHQHSLEQRMQEMEQHMAALQKKIARIKEVEAQRDAAPHAVHAFEQSEASVSAGDLETKNHKRRHINNGH